MVIEQYVKDNEARFIKFINNVGPITIKRHYLEVLPGVGKKLMQEILSSRNKKLFENFEGLHTRVPGFKPLEVFKKRILEELEENDLKHYLFVKKRKSDSGHSERPHSKKREGNQKNYGKNPRNPRYR